MSAVWNRNKESVWDYPRPPKVESVKGTDLKVIHNGKMIAHTTNGLRVLETSHPPVYFIPVEDVNELTLFKKVRDYKCPYKGIIKFYDVVVDQTRADYGAWYVSSPNKGFEELENHIAFFAHRVDECYVDDEKVIPQPGEFFGGWITSNIVGPYKGLPGTDDW